MDRKFFSAIYLDTPGGDWVASGLLMGCGKRSRVCVGLTLDGVEQEVIAPLLMSLAAKDT